MAERDLYHDLVKDALRKEGWRITHNPLRLRWQASNMETRQSEAEEELPLAAEKDERKIAVVVKSFIGCSEVKDLQKAVEQLGLYHLRLHAAEPDRVLYLAVRQTTYRDFFMRAIGAQLLTSPPSLFMVFDPRTEAIVKLDKPFGQR